MRSTKSGTLGILELFGVVLIASLPVPGCGEGQVQGRLSVEETIGAAFSARVESGFPRHMFAHANPEAKPLLYKIIESRPFGVGHSGAILILGYIGVDEDAKLLLKIAESRFEGILTPEERDALDSLFWALGIMAWRGIDSAREALNKFADPRKWMDVGFRKGGRNAEENAFEIALTALNGFALFADPDKIRARRAHFRQVASAALTEKMGWRLPKVKDRVPQDIRGLLKLDQPVKAVDRALALGSFKGHEYLLATPPEAQAPPSSSFNK